MGRSRPAPRQRVWVLLRPEETLTPSDPQLIQDLRRDQNLETADTLTQRLHRMMHERTAAALAPWLTDCHASGCRSWCTSPAAYGASNPRCKPHESCLTVM